ncbi:prenyltransferase [Paenibacillus campi]|uniref:prenyltransferase n=1 Tax=Paenibacillus campi TaxID=3106031 RepID=UPI002AFF200D|nr:prenyltransferase [Paenibacillus sp. SGZ-1009]
MNKWQQFRQASRMHFVPLMAICVVQGTLAAWIWNEQFSLWIALVTMLGSCAAHIFSMMINDLWDYRSGADKAAHASDEAISTDSGYLTSGKWDERTFELVTWSMLGVALVCAAILYVVSGWGVLLLGGLGCFLALFYVVPPIRYGYTGKGMSELAHVLSFGVFPVMGSYYVQTGHFDGRLLLLSLSMGLLTTLTFFNHHFLHWKTDRQVGKRTLVVMWGERKSFRFSVLLLVLALLSVALCALAGVIPMYAVIVLFAAWPLCRMYSYMKQPRRNLQTHQQLLWLSLRTSLQFGILIIAAQLISHWIGT